MRYLWIAVKGLFWGGVIALGLWALTSGGSADADRKGPREGSARNPAVNRNRGDYMVNRVNVPGRGEVTCIVWDGVDRNGGISCDWGK